MLELRNLTFEVPSEDGTRRIANNLNLTVDDGKFVVITGPNGSGKSTLLYLLGGLDRDFTGDIRILGRSINGMDDKQLSNLRSFTMSYVFQFYNLVANLTIEENILLPIELSERSQNVTSWPV